MGLSAIESRIGHIQVQLAALQARAMTGPSATTTATSAVTATNGSNFARILDAAMAPAATTASGWTTPVDGKVTSGYGPRWGSTHKGIDFAATTGESVRAANGGVVRSASWNGGYGNVVVIDHDNGVSTLYAHNSSMTVKPGQRIEAGEVIAKAGSTGHSTGPHVHFEVKVDGETVDPRPWLAQRGITV